MSNKKGRNDPCPCGSGNKYKNCCEGMAARYPQWQAEMQRLISLFHRGSFFDVENGAQVLLHHFPEQGLLWKLLGTAQAIQGKSAIAALQRASQLLPQDAEVFSNLGNAYASQDMLFEAIAGYQQSLRLAPQEPSTLLYLAGALLKQGELEKALQCCQKSLSLDGNDPEKYYCLGEIQHARQVLSEAKAAYQQAILLSPTFADAFNKLGNVLHDMRLLDAAGEAYRQALVLNPRSADIYNNVANLLNEQRQYQKAHEACELALSLAPQFPEAYLNLGNALQGMREFEQALTAFRHALMLRPSYFAANFNLANVYREVGRIAEAREHYQKALALNPESPEAMSGLIFANHYLDDAASLAQQSLAREYGLLLERLVKKSFESWTCEESPRVLRVGLISGDFRAHPVAYFLESLLASLKPMNIELIAYVTSRMHDEMSVRLQGLMSRWTTLYDLNDQEAAQRIHADDVHILIDLSGHTSFNRLPVFAYKPAPLQVSWLGYFATTGVTKIDYILVDEISVPRDEASQFVERVWYLPETRLCFTPPRQEIEVGPLPALKNEYVTLGCFQRLSKITDPVLHLWREILQALPEARLLLMNSEMGCDSLRAIFERRLFDIGIDISRVALKRSEARDQYFISYQQVDFILDTFPYPGGTTTCEALWMGVPTLTLNGRNLLARQGASLMHAAGLKEWIAQDAAEYVRKAVMFSHDLPMLSALRAGLRHHILTSALCDAERFAGFFGEALWGMWRARSEQI